MFKSTSLYAAAIAISVAGSALAQTGGKATFLYTSFDGNVTITNHGGHVLAAVLLKSGNAPLGEFGTGTSILSAGKSVPGTTVDVADLPGNLVWLNFPIGRFDLGKIAKPGGPQWGIGDLTIEYYDGTTLLSPLTMGYAEQFSEPSSGKLLSLGLASTALGRWKRKAAS